MIKKNSKNQVNKSHFLITGCYHSGTTWVGNIIGAHPQVRLYFEPFNIEHGPFKYWMEYISSKTHFVRKQIYKSYLSNILEPKKGATLFFKKIYPQKFHNYEIVNKPYPRHALIKDPLALFSTQWLLENLHLKALILIRHPAAFTASILKRDSIIKLNLLLEQPALMDIILPNFKKPFESFIKNKDKSLLDFSILMWSATHQYIWEIKKANLKNALFKTHEEISKNPVENFNSIFQNFELQVGPEVSELIQKTTSGTPLQSYRTGIYRDTKEHVFFWKKFLSKKQITEIRERTKSLWTNFYDESDW